MPTESHLKTLSVFLNIPFANSHVESRASLLLSESDTKIICVLMIRNEKTILSRNGISGYSHFNMSGTGRVIRTAIHAALAVVFFQKMPSTNMAVIPGLTRPVYSWINWNTCSMPVSIEAIEAASATIMTLDIRPVFTKFFSEICGLKWTL